MLDSLTFILEKLFLLAHLKVFSLLERRSGEEDNNNPKTKHFDRDGGGSQQQPIQQPEQPPQQQQQFLQPPPPQQQRFQRGDLLEVPRTLFTHFGIYLGEGRVAHLIPDVLRPALTGARPAPGLVTNNRLLLGVLSKRASVRVDTVEDFAYGADVLVNTMDARIIGASAVGGGRGGGGGDGGQGGGGDPQRRGRAISGEEVAVRAERLVGPVPFYSLLWNNCEHYVTDCRYGEPVCLQTDKFCEWLKSLIRDQRNVFLTAFLGVLSMACLGVSPGTALPTLLVPFTLWMVS